MYEWCPILQKINEVRELYCHWFGNYGDYNLEEWLEKLKTVYLESELLKVFEPLQINQRGDLVLIRFGLAEMQDKGGEMWSNKNSIYRECRSVVIDIRTMKVVVAPFRKFFNLNEVQENFLENIVEEINESKNVEFTNKMDGSMQCATMYNDRILLTGSKALLEEDSWRLEEGYTMLTDNHIHMITRHPNLTFIFEYISLKDPHVVIYKKEQQGLYLIGIRDKETGRQFSYGEIEIFANTYKVQMTQIENITLGEALRKSKELESCDKEGWVLNIDGHMVKLKCDDYVKLHRCLDKISSVNVIIEAIAENKFDDLFSKIPSGYKERVIAVAEKVYKYEEALKTRVFFYYFGVRYIEDRTEAMKWITKNVPRNIQYYVRCRYDGVEVNYLKTGARYKKLKEMGIVDNISNLFEEE